MSEGAVRSELLFTFDKPSARPLLRTFFFAGLFGSRGTVDLVVTWGIQVPTSARCTAFSEEDLHKSVSLQMR